MIFSSRLSAELPSDAVTTPADYSELGVMLIGLTVFNLLLPFLAILVIRNSRLRSA